MRMIAFRRCLAAVAAVLAAGQAAAQAPDLSKMDVVERSTPAGPVALVDGEPIDREDFLRTYQKHLADVVQMTGRTDMDNEFRVRAGLSTLGELIRRSLLVREAASRGLKAADPEVIKVYQEKLARFQKEMEKAGKAAPTEADVLKAAGQTREEALDSIRRQLLESKAAEAIAKATNIKVKEGDVTEFYNNNPELFKQSGQIHLNQILVRPKPDPQKADENAWKAAESAVAKARARILAGESFGAVARAVSEAPDAAKDGDMGMLPVAQLPPFFVEPAKAMKPGDISGVFRSPFGAHLIRLVEVADSKDVSLEEAKPRIRAMLENVKAEEAVDKFLEPIVNDQSRVRIFLQIERTIAALTFKGGKLEAQTAGDAAKPAAKTGSKQPAKPAPAAKNGGKKGK